MTAVAIITDNWTCINDISYTAFTEHFFSDNYSLESVLLDWGTFNNKHTAENKSFLENTVKTFVIQKIKLLLASQTILRMK